MQTIFHLRASELNDRFIESIRALFQDHMIEITISDVGLAPPEEARPREAGDLPGRIRPKVSSPGDRIGVAKGLFDVPDDIDAHNVEVGRLFLGENLGDSAS
ncbi:hypothetical protein [uncultured Lamprocystis sp.]|jgi:hypothetical protein|uniref:hypothetical protein n=1 Tax=uncultured Lamprocystis sp. TaxID=543132 RepID=UPI0025E73138|nr:hypothetical protein [uncultured Lamprocystis sp.]